MAERGNAAGSGAAGEDERGTDGGVAGLSDAARELALRCEPRVNELARRMARDAFERIPGYAAIPGDMKDLEIAATARYGMRLFMRRVRDPNARHGDNGLFRERAAQRAEEGVPLHLLLRSHSMGVHVLWQALRESARPGEDAALTELADLLLRTHESTIGAVAQAYMDERAALDAERREHRRSLVRALLDGSLGAGTGAAPPCPRGTGTPDSAADHAEEEAEERAAREAEGNVGNTHSGRDGRSGRLAELGLEPGGACLVLALAVPASSGQDSPVARRRVLRRVQTVLDHAFGTEVASLLDGAHDGGIGKAVVPGSPEPPPGLMDRLRRASGGPVRAAAVSARTPDEVPQAARTAAEVVRVARAAGLPPGLHRLEDVLLEFHLSRRDASSGAIAALLDPLGGSPELTGTLRVHLEQSQRRRDTARLLGVHPNTVDNRLARITELTGLDLSAPRGTALALAALLLRGEAGAPEQP
ncbi:PucR family transcriptional regulator [Streptomyces daliensis]